MNHPIGVHDLPNDNFKIIIPAKPSGFLMMNLASTLHNCIKKCMPNTYTQIHIQSVFAVKYRAALLDKQWRARLFQYMIGIMNHLGHRTLALNGVEDHVHIFFGLKPDKSISESMKMLKGESSKWINENHFSRRHFEWQGGFGAFSYRRSDVPQIVRYIHNQEEHHRKVLFVDEYKGFLKEFDVEFDERYILMPPE